MLVTNPFVGTLFLLRKADLVGEGVAVRCLSRSPARNGCEVHAGCLVLEPHAHHESGRGDHCVRRPNGRSRRRRRPARARIGGGRAYRNSPRSIGRHPPRRPGCVQLAASDDRVMDRVFTGDRSGRAHEGGRPIRRCRPGRQPRSHSSRDGISRSGMEPKVASSADVASCGDTFCGVAWRFWAAHRSPRSSSRRAGGGGVPGRVEPSRSMYSAVHALPCRARPGRTAGPRSRRGSRLNSSTSAVAAQGRYECAVDEHRRHGLLERARQRDADVGVLRLAPGR